MELLPCKVHFYLNLSCCLEAKILSSKVDFGPLGYLKDKELQLIAMIRLSLWNCQIEWSNTWMLNKEC